MKNGKKFKRGCGINMVWNPNENDVKILEYVYDHPEGSRARYIKKYCGFKTSTLYKRLNILRERGLVIDEFPVWKLVNGEVKFI
jgi:predicted transcriptional regulator